MSPVYTGRRAGVEGLRKYFLSFYSARMAFNDRGNQWRSPPKALTLTLSQWEREKNCAMLIGLNGFQLYHADELCAYL